MAKAQVNVVMGMLKVGRSLKEIADALHTSVSAVSGAVREDAFEEARQMWGRL